MCTQCNWSKLQVDQDRCEGREAVSESIATGMFFSAFISVNISALSEVIHSHYGWT